MKKMKVLLICIGAAALGLGAIAFGIGTIYETTSNHTTYYYGQIDNGSVSGITPHGGMNYQYALHVYKENGEGTDMTLDTSRILRDGAFIRIEVAPMRGVIGWAEMLLDELPEAVRGKYAA